jgi:hypothetical protein
MMDKVRQRAARGALLLDKTNPGWADRINLGTFQIQSHCYCILGQLYLEFSIGTNILFGSVCYREQVEEHGFDAGVGIALTAFTQFNLLQEAWVEEILNRRTPPATWTHREEKKELVTAE